MFNRLSLTAQSNQFFRCQSCKSILFRQSDIDQYLSHDPNNYGKLDKFTNYPNCALNNNKKTKQEKQQPKPAHQHSAQNPQRKQTKQPPQPLTTNSQPHQYFLLSNQLHVSSFSLNPSQQILINCHPFLKMYLSFISCKQCKYQIGFKINTVNENTIYLKNRIIVNVNKILCRNNNKQNIKKILKVLENKVSQRVNESSDGIDQRKKQYQKNNKSKNQQKQQQILTRLTQISDKFIQQHKQKQTTKELHNNNHNNTKSTPQQQYPNIFPSYYNDTKQFIHNEYLSTLPFTNAIQKCSNSYMGSVGVINMNTNANVNTNMNSNNNVNNNANQFGSFIQKNYDTTIERESQKHQYYQNNNINDKQYQQNKSLYTINKLHPFLFQPPLLSLQLLPTLSTHQSLILQQSHILPQYSSLPILRIFTQLNKLDSLMKIIDEKIPGQLIGLENVLTVIRHRIIKPIQERG